MDTRSPVSINPQTSIDTAQMAKKVFQAAAAVQEFSDSAPLVESTPEYGAAKLENEGVIAQIMHKKDKRNIVERIVALLLGPEAMFVYNSTAVVISEITDFVAEMGVAVDVRTVMNTLDKFVCLGR